MYMVCMRIYPPNEPRSGWPFRQTSIGAVVASAFQCRDLTSIGNHTRGKLSIFGVPHHPDRDARGICFRTGGMLVGSGPRLPAAMTFERNSVACQVTPFCIMTMQKFHEMSLLAVVHVCVMRSLLCAVIFGSYLLLHLPRIRAHSSSEFRWVHI